MSGVLDPTLPAYKMPLPSYHTPTTVTKDAGWSVLGADGADPAAFKQQLEKIATWIDVWNHEERCSLLRVLMSWGRHRQFQFLRTVSLPALHRDMMYSAQQVCPDKPLIPLSTFYSRKLKNRHEILSRRSNGASFHRIDSAHLQRQDQLEEILDELKLPRIPTTLSRDHTWSGRTLAERDTLSWGIAPSRDNTQIINPLCSGSQLSAKRTGSDMKATSPDRVARGHTVTNLETTDLDGMNADRGPLGFSTPKDGGRSPRRPQDNNGGNKRSVTWSALKFHQRDCAQPIKRSVSSGHGNGADGTDQSHQELGQSLKTRLPDDPDTEVRRPETNNYVTQSCEAQRTGPMTLQQRKSNKNKQPLRRSVTQITRSGLNKSSSNIKIHQSSRGNKRADDVIQNVSTEGLRVLEWYLVSWNDAQRNEFLQRFLRSLDPRQQYFVSSMLAVNSYKDFISLLPESIAMKILSYLSTRQLLRASLVCKRWYKLCNSNKMWKIKCSQIQMVIPVLSSKPNWKKIYQDNRSIRSNWEEGNCKVVDCKGHTDRVLSVTFDERRMATGSVDKMIRVWNLDTGKCTQTLKGHLRGVWCLRFLSKNLLISGSYDCSIKVWNLKDSSCVRTMLGHEGPVWALAWRGSKLVSGSHDKTARIWDVGRCYFLHVLKGHNGAVYCVDMDETGELAITGSSDKTVRLWDTTTGTQRLVIRVSERSAVMAVSYRHRMLACSHWDTIAIYRLNKKHNEAKLVRTYEEHYKRIESLELNVDMERGVATLISGGRDGVLKYWDISKEKSVQTYKGHNRTINCVHCDAFRIATASYDNKIKIWDFRS